MRLQDIAAPVSADDPCGPDLDEEGDEAYLNYVLAAAGRIPESFYQKDPSAPVNESRYLPFDRTSVDLRQEVKAIEGLLARTKDLRLLTLGARFHCLGGQVIGFCECLAAMEELVSAYWDGVHPRGDDGDFTMRQNTLSGLDDQTSILLPLGYAGLIVNKKASAISLRDYLIANGSLQPRAGERKLELSEVLESFQGPEARAAVETLNRSVGDALKALATIDAKFIAEAGHAYSPGFANLLKVLGQMQTLLHAAVPELAAATPSIPEVADLADQAGPPEEPQTAPAARQTQAPALALADHGAADAALLAVVEYFARSEPSSPALILIHQARMLVGKPLVEALEMLMPEGAAKAAIAFTGGPAFQLDIAKMKAITDVVVKANGADAKPSAAYRFEAKSRQDAEQLISSADAFFRATEPSSPIPMLIGRARLFMTKDFAAIIADLMKGDAPSPTS